MAEFDENKHPRDDDGEFKKKLGGSSEQSDEAKTYEFNPPKHIELSPTNVVKKVTPQEWARFYTVLGQIRAGTFTPLKTPKGEKIIRIDSKVFLDSGSFEKPKVKTVYSFKDEQHITFFIDRLRRK